MRWRMGTALLVILLTLGVLGCQGSRGPSEDRIVFKDNPSPSKVQPQQKRQQKDPDQAINEPGMDSETIPEDRGLFQPFEEQQLTPKDLLLQRRIMNALWKTPLGQMYLAYMFDDVGPVRTTRRSWELVNRVFSESRQVTTRIVALQLLTDDLYKRDRMTEEAMKRAYLLDGKISERRLNEAQDSRSQVVYEAALFFLAALPFGSQAVREETMNMGRSLWVGVKRVFRRGEVGAAPGHHLRRLFTREVFHDYKVTSAVNFFFATFGPYSMIYWLWNDWLPGATGSAMTDTRLLYGLDSLLKMANL